MTPPRSERTDLTRRGFLAGAAVTVAGVVAGCGVAAAPAPAPAAAPPPAPSPAPAPAAVDLAAPADQVAARATVPVLCYHQLRAPTPADSAEARALYVCPPEVFGAHLDALAAGGFSTIGPDAYLAHLTTGAPLPPRPVLLSFDDSHDDHVAVALPELARRGMTGTFFVMTVPLGQPNWLTRDGVRRLHDGGMTVAAHTWDHHRVDRYAGDDWRIQLDEPRATLEGIVGAPVRHFAYPFGAWAPDGFPHLDEAGYETAFQLADDPLDPSRPLLSLRRALVDSSWTGEDVIARVSRPI